MWVSIEANVQHVLNIIHISATPQLLFGAYDQEHDALGGMFTDQHGQILLPHQL